ncbi:MAG: hypothetical protein O3A01_07395 [bacterium]|nr:hypothetical protein [bacterium]
MSSISNNKIILVIDTDSGLADSLSAHLHNHEIIHVKNEMEADLKYREIVTEDRQINLIVL